MPTMIDPVSDYAYFCNGLKHAIRSKGYSLKSFSKGIVGYSYFCKTLSFGSSTRLGEKNREKCAKKLGLTVSEIIELGRTGNSPKKTHTDKTNKRSKISTQEKYFFELYQEYRNEDIVDEFIKILVEEKKMVKKESAHKKTVRKIIKKTKS